jgi:DNA-binding MarR family transcriptional regulator
MSATSNAVDPDARIESDIRSAPPCLLLAKLGREAMRQFAEALGPSELSPAHLTALHLLRARPVSQQVLSEAIAVDPTKLVGLLNDLEEANLVVRRRHPDDRRRHIVEISEAGRKRLAAAEQLAEQVQERLFAGLGAAEREELGRLLRHIAGNTPLATSNVHDPSLDFPS